MVEVLPGELGASVDRPLVVVVGVHPTPLVLENGPLVAVHALPPAPLGGVVGGVVVHTAPTVHALPAHHTHSLQARNKLLNQSNNQYI